jgi:diamine N-acetyltransferase
MITRAALPSDIPQIVAIEQIPEYRSYIGTWSAEEHLRAIADPDNEYFVVSSDDDTGDTIQGRLLLEYGMLRAFLHHHAHRLWLDVFETNTRARRIYEDYGFRYDGVLREAILRDGAYHTLALMSLLDHEYTARQQSTPQAVTTTARS